MAMLAILVDCLVINFLAGIIGGRMEEFNGYSFNNKKMRKRMKYIVIRGGDLDLNGAYAFKSERELKKFIKEYETCYREIEAIFEVKDVSQKYL